MQIVSFGDNLHEVSDPIFLEKKEKYQQFVVCSIRPLRGKCWIKKKHLSRAMIMVWNIIPLRLLN